MSTYSAFAVIPISCTEMVCVSCLVWQDEFNFKVPWEMDAEVKEVWDQIPLVADIAEQLQQQNESVT